MRRWQADVVVILILTILVLMGLGGCAGIAPTPVHERPDVVSKSTWSAALPVEHSIDPAW